MIFTSEQHRSIQVFTYIHTRKVLLPHSKHYYEHPICFPLCNTDFKSVRFILHALWLDYIYRSCRVMFESDLESRTDITIWRQLCIYNKCHTFS